MTTKKRECYTSLLGKLEDLDAQIRRLGEQVTELKQLVIIQSPSDDKSQPPRAHNKNIGDA